MSQGFTSFTRPEDVQAGLIAQVVNVEDGELATGATVFPNDDTIPQNTEGNEFMTLAITPKHADSTLFVEVVCIVASSNVGRAIIALFQDDTANALAVCTENLARADDSCTFVLNHYVAATSTLETTFKVRAGDTAATMTFNGESAARKYGGAIASSITITEIRAFEPAQVVDNKVVQVVNMQDGGVATGTTLHPLDDTAAPQNTEGDEYMTLAITPALSVNLLKIEVQIQIGNATAARWLIASLFQDSTADGLATTAAYHATNTEHSGLTITYWMTAGTTSATTFKVRAGSSGSGTITFNGQSGARQFFGLMASTMTITEYQPN